MRLCRLSVLVVMVVLALSSCASDYESKAATAEAELDIALEQAEAGSRAAQGRAGAAARAEQAKRDKDALMVAARVKRAAATAAMQKSTRESSARDEIQAAFNVGWGQGCLELFPADRTHEGVTVTFADCFALLEPTDVATLEDAQDFGGYMARYATFERYGYPLCSPTDCASPDDAG